MARRLALAAGLAASFLLHTPTLSAQTARDTLLLGRRAYERVDFEGAVRLLPIGLTAGGAASDTMWVGAVHMFTDALLEQSQDTLAQIWARWATRIAPGFPIDSNVYPPRVARLLAAARQAAGTGLAADTFANTAWDADPSLTAGRGVLRIQRGGPGSLAVIEGVGTVLPGETRTLPAGTYAIRISADGFVTATIAREVLPGYVTVITPRLARPGAATATRPAGSGDAPATVRPTIRPARLAAAGSDTCVILESGGASCWGSNMFGQLGSGLFDSTRRTPVTLGTEQGFSALAMGPSHGCALTAEGRAWCWGLGTSGELGNARSTSSASPVPVSMTQPFEQVVSGMAHTCALRVAGAVFCWGANRSGILGNRTSAPSNAPTAIAGPANVSFTMLAAGAYHTCALASNGAAYCWGVNAGGQLGNGSTNDATAPVMVQSSVSFQAITAGTAHTCGLATTGAAWCWGANSSGQLGSGAVSDDSPRPAAVTGELTFTGIWAGDMHTCGLTADGAAYCWGAGRSGQLGNGQLADSHRPVLVVGGHVFRTLGLGSGHSCGLSGDGITWCWGDNSSGQIGGLAGRSTSTPVAVVVRPPVRQPEPGATVVTAVREAFTDGNYTAAPAWLADNEAGARIAVIDSALDVSRSVSRGQVAAAGITMPVRIPVSRATELQFDVMVRASSAGCGLNCASYPAVVRLRVKNSDLTESEVWYAYGDKGGRSRSLGHVVIVARGDLRPGVWQTERVTIRDALPRADTILQVSLGGVAGDFAARFDNILLPVPVAATLTIAPDSLRPMNARARATLRAAVRDASGALLPSVPVRWTSGDTAVARVDSVGVVTAVGAGRTFIKAVSATAVDSAAVTVRAPSRRPRRS